MSYPSKETDQMNEQTESVENHRLDAKDVESKENRQSHAVKSEPESMEGYSTGKPVRVPGIVEEPTAPIDNRPSPFPQQGQGSEKSARKPGKILEPTEKIPEENNEQPENTLDGSIVKEDSPWKWVGVALIGWFVFQPVVAVLDALDQAWLEGALFAMITVVVFAVLLWAIYHERQAYQRVDQFPERQEKIKKSVESNDLGGIQRALEPSLEKIRINQPKLVDEFKAGAEQRDHAQDYFDLFDNLVLSALDKQANDAIKRAVMTASAGVAISPNSALDALIVLWRANVLIKQIGNIYGLQPTGLSSIRLIHHAVVSAVIAGSLEEFGHAVTAQLTQEGLVKILKPLGESTATGIRLYRLGNLAQKYCRPGI